MLTLSPAFRRELYHDRRRYLRFADITLSDNTVLHLINDDLWENGFSINDAVSSDGNFDIGAAIINSAKLSVKNLDDQYTAYDFKDARVVLYVGLLIGENVERVRKGTYIVDEATYNGASINLSMLDNMSKFDKPYSESTLHYPATLATIVRDACTRCEVTLNTYEFPHSDHIVQARPDDEAMTYREVISYAAQIAGCFARCNVNGQLELKWYDQNTLENFDSNNTDGGSFDNGTPRYSTGATLNGGSFNPWNTGDAEDGGAFGSYPGVHIIPSTFSHDLGVDDVVITGVTVLVKTQNQNSETAIVSYTSGSAGYLISIEENPLITTDTGQTIANWLGIQLIGLRFRRGTINHLSDPAIEAGDCAIVYDRKGIHYPILISSTNFAPGGAQRSTSSAQTPARNSAQRYSIETKNYVQLRNEIRRERSAREQALLEFARRIAESPGLYTTVETTQSGASIFYMHDMPTLASSSIVWKMTAEAWGVTTHYNGADTVWNGGMTVDGDTITRILTAVGINVDYINITGRLTDAQSRNYWDFDTGEFQLVPSAVKTGSGSDTLQDYIASTSGTAASSAATTAVNNAMTQQAIFNKLTDNRQNQGIFLQNGDLFLNASMMSTGEMLADRIRLYDKMTVYDGATGNVVGGYIGYATGYQDGQQTTGMWFKNGNENNYLIVTNGGVRMTANNPGYSSNGFWVVPTGSFSLRKLTVQNGGLDVTGNIKFYGDLIFKKPSGVAEGDLKDVKDISADGDISGRDITASNMVIVGVQVKSNQSVWAGTWISAQGDITCGGTKSRVVETDDYSDRLLYCYEMPSPIFGDLGSATIAEDGRAYVYIDPVFAETVNTSNYQVFLQAYGPDPVYVSERTSAYFVVAGTPGTEFGWEIKAKQSDFDQRRLEEKKLDAEIPQQPDYVVSPQIGPDYGEMAAEHIESLKEGRRAA